LENIECEKRLGDNQKKGLAIEIIEVFENKSPSLK
jgi:hypothetical protein